MLQCSSCELLVISREKGPFDDSVLPSILWLNRLWRRKGQRQRTAGEIWSGVQRETDVINPIIDNINTPLIWGWFWPPVSGNWGYIVWSSLFSGLHIIQNALLPSVVSSLPLYLGRQILLSGQQIYGAVPPQLRHTAGFGWRHPDFPFSMPQQFRQLKFVWLRHQKSSKPCEMRLFAWRKGWRQRKGQEGKGWELPTSTASQLGKVWNLQDLSIPSKLSESKYETGFTWIWRRIERVLQIPNQHCFLMSWHWRPCLVAWWLMEHG